MARNYNKGIKIARKIAEIFLICTDSIENASESNKCFSGRSQYTPYEDVNYEEVPTIPKYNKSLERPLKWKSKKR